MIFRFFNSCNRTEREADDNVAPTAVHTRSNDEARPVKCEDEDDVVAPTPVRSDDEVTMLDQRAVASNQSTEMPNKIQQQQEENKKQICEIVYTDLQSDDAHKIEESFQALYYLTAFDELNRKALCGMGGHFVILHLLQKHMNLCAVQSFGLSTLLSVIIDNDGIMEQMANARAVSIVVESMKQHPEEDFVQQVGYSFLSNLSSGPQTVKKAIIMGGGVGIIVTALKKYPDHHATQLEGFYALKDLNAVPEGKEVIWKAGGVSAIMGTIEKHLDDEFLVELAKDTLKSLMDWIGM